MINFLKKWFIFDVDIKEKEIYRVRVMRGDHKTYKGLLIAIIVLQAFMLVFGLIGRSKTSNLEQQCYNGLYIFLLLSCIVSYLLLEFLYKKNKAFAYYIVVSFTMLFIMLWGAGISLIDSENHTNLFYLSLSVLTCSMLICIEPWVSTIAVLLTCGLFSFLFVTVDFVQPHAGFGFVIALVTLALVSIIGSTFNFIRRINSFNLEIEVTQLNTALEDKAYVDELTQVYSRRYLTERIKTKMNSGILCSGVLMIDVDNFKNINDMYGDSTGDLCLQNFGKQLQTFVSSLQGAYCVRFGGDKFLVFIPLTDSHTIVALAESFRERIEHNKIKIDNKDTITLTISIGIAIAEKEAKYEELISASEKALLRAKEKKNISVL